jgi:hypothetical protein
MKRRNNRRRVRGLHDGHTANDRVSIDTVRAALDNGETSGIDRLILLCAVASGASELSLTELRAEVCRKVIEAGSVGAAIERQIVLR